ALASTLKLLGIPILALLLIRLANRLGKQIVARIQQNSEEGDQEQEKRAQTLIDVLKAFWAIIVWLMAVIYMLQLINVDVTPLIASAGVAGLAVAFGARPLVQDWFAGFFMLLENQYKVGDWIVVGSVTGFVERITLRLTVIRGFDGTLHFMPNGKIRQIGNKSKGWFKINVDVFIDSNEDIEAIIDKLDEVNQNLYNDEAYHDIYFAPPMDSVLVAINETTVQLRMQFKAVAGKQWPLYFGAKRVVFNTLKEMGITAAYPHRIIHSFIEEEEETTIKEKKHVSQKILDEEADATA
ncbi:mechanosensitive ion channel family protein, partial [Magnetococcales bacterium HHB-1]